MPLIGGVYFAWAGSGVGGLFVRGIIAAVCLLPPTFLMGATLPAVARWVETTPQGVSWLGFFYGGNIAGAVLGSLLAGFYLLRVFDVSVATYVAVALNVARCGGGLAGRPGDADPSGGSAATAGARAAADAGPAAGAWAVYLAIALSGMTALAAEVVWTRLLSLLFGATVYTFSLILAVFLIGLGIGSSVGAAIGRSVARPRIALGVCQLLLCGAIAWTAYMLTESLPYWPINPSISLNPWFTLQLDLVRCMWAVLPGAILWGASFPLALASVAAAWPGSGTAGRRRLRREHAGRHRRIAWRQPRAGRVDRQPARRAGADCVVAGARACSCWRGASSTRKTSADERSGRRRSAWWPSRAWRWCWRAGVSPLPGVLVAYGRYTPTRIGEGEIIYVGEGLTASVAVSRLQNGVLNYHNAGKIQASSEPQDMRLQRMLGHLTTLVSEPKTVVVIGCGAGVTAGAVSIDPRGAERDHRRDRAAGAARRLDVLRRAQLQRRQEPEGSRPDRRRTSLRRDAEGQVRRPDVGSAGPVGQGRRDALHARVLRGRQGASESRRRGDAVRAAVREQHRSGEERDRDVPRGLSERHGVWQHQQRRSATTSCCSDRWSRPRSIST